MPIFTYKGRSLRGEAVAGQLEGDTPEAVATRLFNSGVTPIEITAAKNKEQADIGELWRRLGGGKPRTVDIIMFSRQMYTITKSGIPLMRGLRGLAESTHNVTLRRALEDVIASLESGRDLATSFARHPDIFGTLYVSIIRVGESTGTLDSAFLRLCEYLSVDQDVQDRVRTAMRYPLIVMCVIALAIGVITVFVIPNFAPLFKVLGNDIPLPTRIIMGLSEFTVKYWYVVLGAIAAVIFGARKYVSTEKGRYLWHKRKLEIPVMGALSHQAILSRISRSLAISLKAGMPMIQTLNVIARSSGNDYMAERVLRLRDAVERGDPISRAAATVGMFPPLVLQMMAVGEETGDLAELLDEVADFYQREVDYTLKNLSAMIEPILIVFVGGAVLILALGVFLPMWNMIAKVGGAH
jgi:MSHA biogenesis protein MshG